MIRKVTDQELKEYVKMVNFFIKKQVINNFNASMKKADNEVSLGNTGMTVSDMRQYLLSEVVVALQKYNPNYLTPDGKTVEESTFVYGHLWKRLGSKIKKMVNNNKGYGVWHSSLEEVLGENDED
jgi:hypothetical protein